MFFNKSYESYIKLILIIATILAIYFSGSSIRTLNLLGLALNVIGTIFLVYGSFDSLNPLIWSNANEPPSLKRDYKHLFEENYGLILSDQDLTNGSADYLDYGLALTAKRPLLRSKAAEFGPWLIFIGFLIQFYAVWIDP